MSGAVFPDDFPEFVEYSKKKLATQKDTIEYLARFGPPILKEGARAILAAAGEGDKLGK